MTQITRDNNLVKKHVVLSRNTSNPPEDGAQHAEAYRRNVVNTVYTQKYGAVSKVNKKSISHLTRAKRTPSAASTVQVSYALPAVRFSCFLRGRGASFQDGVAAGKGFLCAPF